MSNSLPGRPENDNTQSRTLYILFSPSAGIHVFYEPEYI